MSSLKEDMKKTRWGLMGKILLWIIIIPFGLILWLGRESIPEQPAVTITNEVHVTVEQLPSPYFDYAKISEAIGSGFSERRITKEGEEWINKDYPTIVKIIGTPSAVEQVGILIPENLSEESATFGFLILRQLSRALVGDNSASDWFSQLNANFNESKKQVFNDVLVGVKWIKQDNLTIAFLVFMPAHQ